VSAERAAPARVKVPLPQADNTWFVVALAAQALCLLVAVRHLVILRDVMPAAETFVNAPKPDPNDFLGTVLWMRDETSPWFQWVDTVNAVNSSRWLLLGALAVAAIVGAIWLARMNYWFADAGRPYGYNRLVAFWVLVATSVAWLVVGVAWSPAFHGQERSLNDIQQYVDMVSLNTEIRMGLTVVCALCIYRIWHVVRYLPFDASPAPVGIVDVGSQLPALPEV
jgi:hypothetical protein